MTTEETGALGAAIMAAWGVGAFRTLEEAVASMVHVARRQEPDRTRTMIYRAASARRKAVTIEA